MSSNAVVSNSTVSQALLYIPFVSETIGLTQFICAEIKHHNEDFIAKRKLFKAACINLTAGQGFMALIPFFILQVIPEMYPGPLIPEMYGDANV